MWSVGVLSYILLSGKLPFLGKNDHQTLSLIKMGLIQKLDLEIKLGKKLAIMPKILLSNYCR